MSAPVVQRMPCTDRYMTCASCRGWAKYIVLRDGKTWYASCARHVKLHEQRAAKLTG